MKNINEFKRGDKIVRVEPAEPYGGYGGCRDRSYLGIPFIFIGIANGLIYLEHSDKESFESRMFGGKNSIPTDVWSNGWDLWVNPEDLKAGIEIKHNKAELEKLLQDAIDLEDYEKAEILKAKLNAN